MSRGERVESPEGPLATSGTTVDEWVRPSEVDSGRRSSPVGGGEPRLSAHLFFCPQKKPGRHPEAPTGSQCPIEIGLARNRQEESTGSPMRVRLQQHAEVRIELVEDRQRGRPE